jgi:HlyD family secretion protein
MKMKVRPRLVIAGLSCVVLIVGVGAAAVLLRKPTVIPPEKIVTAERGDIARSVVARGKIEPLSKVDVKSKANGIIKALLVDVGDAVTEGQILAELDKEDLQAQVREAQVREAKVREAKATRDGEEANASRPWAKN